MIKATQPAPRRRSFDDNPAAAQAGASYFASSERRARESDLEFVSSGSVLLDQVLGGGYALGRMTNIIGDKSTGKTLLAIEACVNFKLKYPEGLIRYGEAESAFDKAYAAALGMPVDDIEWVDWTAQVKKKKADKKERGTDRSEEKQKEDEAKAADGALDVTVERFGEDVHQTLGKLGDRPCLYVLDSLDALSDRGEMDSDSFEKEGYGQGKARAMHQFFRKLHAELERRRALLIIVSQIKDKIGVTFGETKMRTGGHSMDFYATHCLWLAHIERLKKTVGGQDRIYGVTVKAQCKKNKIGLPFRECEFPILFGFGIDDLTAHVEWLIDAGPAARLTDVDMSKSGYAVRINALRNRGGSDLRDVREALNRIVVEEWTRIEHSILPKRGKYE